MSSLKLITRKTAPFSFLLCISICFHVGKSQTRIISCSDDSVYDVSSATGREYRNNLETLLDTLYSNATTPTGFYNYTTGTGNATVYGLFLCRGDVSPGDCQTCLRTATDMAFTTAGCPNQTRANIYDDNCMLRFSDQSIFSKLDTPFAWLLWDPNGNYSDGTLLKQVLNSTFSAIASKAAYGHEFPGKRFAVQEAGLKVLEKIYALAQCTPDLTDLQCDNCLTKAIQNLPACCTNRKGGRVIYPSCNIRYESSPFYRNPTVAPTPPPAVAPTPPPAVAPTPPPPPPPVPGPGSNQAIFFFCIAKRSRKRKELVVADEITDTGVSHISTESESLRYNFSQVQAYTNSFAVENLIVRVDLVLFTSTVNLIPMKITQMDITEEKVSGEAAT